MRWLSTAGGMWLFGEDAVYGWSEGDEPNQLDASAVLETRRLFPESIYADGKDDDGWHH